MDRKVVFFRPSGDCWLWSSAGHQCSTWHYFPRLATARLAARASLYTRRNAMVQRRLLRRDLPWFDCRRVRDTAARQRRTDRSSESDAGVLLLCGAICTLSIVAANLPAGPLLLGLFLIIGFAALGMFPNYYSFSQELTVRHQGKLTGALGCVCWLAMSLLHEVVGDSIERTGSYTTSVAVAGLAPLLAVAALVLFWGRNALTTSRFVSAEGSFTPKLNGEAIQPSASIGVQK